MTTKYDTCSWTGFTSEGKRKVIEAIFGSSDKFGMQMIDQLEYCINVKFTKVGNWTVIV